MKRSFKERLLVKSGKRMCLAARVMAILALLAALAFIWSHVSPFVRAWQIRRSAAAKAASITASHDVPAPASVPAEPAAPAPSPSPEPSAVPAEDDLAVHFINVGHGDCILVRCEGRDMLIDAGYEEAGSGVISYLRRQQVKSLDYIAASHEHRDHVGGLRYVASAVPFDKALAPFDRALAKPWFRSFKEEVERQGKRITVPRLGGTFALGGAEITVLGPQESDYTVAPDNNRSLILRLVYGRHSFLFTGDAQAEAERDLLEYAERNGLNLRTEVLKAGHHGKRNASTPRFLEMVRPQLAVVSSGSPKKDRDLRDEARLDRDLKRVSPNVKILRTNRDGTIVVHGGKYTALQADTEYAR